MNPGTRLGPYEITAHIGAGGMGEVFRARDERLGRDVAIKILPRAFTADDERVKRFEQEARAAGSLNHPNLITTFDAGTHDGTAYIVMELLEGETLREKLGDGARIPLRKAIDYSVQAATGLAAAHDKGIVHRDLKPENLFVCKDGRVKILDFGLAKLTAANSDPNAPTQRMATTPGMVMGTVAYMSPEQVRAQNVDHRSDIFSFGAILFEMLTGRRAFEGSTAADLMSSILHADPPELASMNGDTPPVLAGIVRHCLEKSPDERFQSVRDLAFHLQTVSGSSASAAKAIAPKRSRLPLIVIVAVVIAVAAAMALAHRAGYRIAKPRPAISGATQLTSLPGLEAFASLAPDGKTFVFDSAISGHGDIYLQRIDGRNAINLTKDSPGDDYQPVFSPDGSQIAFRSERSGGGLFVMGATGETVRRISDFGFNPAWSPDGTQIVCSTESVEFNPRGRGTNSELWIIDVKSGAKRMLTRQARPAQPHWSPHGNRIVYWTVDAHSQRDLMTIDASAPNATPVALTHDAPLDWNPVWSPDGRFIYFGSDRGGSMAMWRIAVDEPSGSAKGEPELVMLPARVPAHFSFDASGKHILFCSFEQLESVRRAPRNGGSITTVVGGTVPFFKYSLSPDGQWIAYTTQGGDEQIFIARSDGSEWRQITDSPDLKRAVSWMPDGGKLLFYSNRTGRMEGWQINADGSGLAKYTDIDVAPWYPIMSPDGTKIAIYDVANSYVMPAAPLPVRTYEAFPIPKPGAHFAVNAWAPDSRHVVGNFIHDRDVQGEESTVIYDTVTKQYETVAAFGWDASYIDGGKALLIADHDKLKVLDLATRAVIQLPISTGISDRVSVFGSPDGKWVYWSERHMEGDVWRATLADQ